MAEGFAKYFAKIYNKNIEEIYSAGSNPTGYVHPLAIKVMKEISIDISNQYSKSLNEIPYKELNLVALLQSWKNLVLSYLKLITF